MISLIIPFIDQLELLDPVVEQALALAGEPIELILIDNGSVNKYDKYPVIRNETNLGIIETFKQGYEASRGDILFYIHSDCLLHEADWAIKLQQWFDEYNLGLGGLFGAEQATLDGGRQSCYSNMLGKVWGSCNCHSAVVYHHGNLTTQVRPATLLDGVGMAFSRKLMQELIEQTDTFADWRSIFHFYDKIVSLKAILLGYRVATIPLAFDHYGSATSSGSDIYRQTASKWLTDHGYTAGSDPDVDIMKLAEQQYMEEFSKYLPITVNDNYVYTSNGVKIATT